MLIGLFDIMVSGHMLGPYHYNTRSYHFQNVGELAALVLASESNEFQITIKLVIQHGWHHVLLAMIRTPLDTVEVAATTDSQDTITTEYAFFSTLMFSYLRIGFALTFFWNMGVASSSIPSNRICVSAAFRSRERSVSDAGCFLRGVCQAYGGVAPLKECRPPPWACVSASRRRLE
jgi:hypothetical protein